MNKYEKYKNKYNIQKNKVNELIKKIRDGESKNDDDSDIILKNLNTITTLNFFVENPIIIYVTGIYGVGKTTIIDLLLTNIEENNMTGNFFNFNQFICLTD